MWGRSGVGGEGGKAGGVKSSVVILGLGCRMAVSCRHERPQRERVRRSSGGWGWGFPWRDLRGRCIIYQGSGYSAVL